MKISIGMRTIDKRGSSYLKQTLDNLARSGVFDSPQFASMDLVDSGSKDPEKHLSCASDYPIVCHTSGKITPNEAANLAHEKADAHGSDWVIFMEDDLDFCGDFLGSTARWLKRHTSPKYPLYLLGSQTAPGHKSDTRPVLVKRFYGTQCYAVNKSVSAQLSKWLNAHPLRGKVGRGHDLRLHDWTAEIKKTHFLATSPSFVQHIGKESSMGCKYFRFKSWPGHKWTYQL